MTAPNDAPSPDEIAEHYDSLGEFYREVWGDRLHHGYWIDTSDSTGRAIQNLENTVIDLAGVSPGDRVFDVGSGYGSLALRLAQEFHAQVSGWTLSESQREVAEKAASQLTEQIPQPVFHCRDWLQADLAHDSCDAILSLECVSHISDRTGFFQKSAKALRPGGRLVITDWMAPPHCSAAQRRWLLEPICREGRLAGLASTEKLIREANEAGLTVMESKEISSQVRKTWRVITNRLIVNVFKDPRYRRFLLETLRSDRIFALTIGRLLLAYHTGALEYGILVAEKPAQIQKKK